MEECFECVLKAFRVHVAEKLQKAPLKEYIKASRGEFRYFALSFPRFLPSHLLHPSRISPLLNIVIYGFVRRQPGGVSAYHTYVSRVKNCLIGKQFSERGKQSTFFIWQSMFELCVYVFFSFNEKKVFEFCAKFLISFLMKGVIYIQALYSGI